MIQKIRNILNLPRAIFLFIAMGAVFGWTLTTGFIKEKIQGR